MIGSSGGDNNEADVGDVGVDVGDAEAHDQADIDDADWGNVDDDGE